MDHALNRVAACHMVILFELTQSRHVSQYLLNLGVFSLLLGEVIDRLKVLVLA